MGIPSHKAHTIVSLWKMHTIPPNVLLQPFSMLMGFLTVRHFYGLWAVGFLLGSTQDVDLVTLWIRGVVCIPISMMDTSVF
jgi:hypothetical protein